MKTIIITRHAKSSWANIGQTDFDRPLNDRGLNDAPMMGKRLSERNIKIDAVISSTAARAKQTATLIANEININEDAIIFYNNLYHAPTNIIDDLLCGLNNNLETIILVCHNPGITYWINEQIGYLLDNMPTCGMASFAANINDWTNFKASKKEMLFIDYPKNI